MKKLSSLLAVCTLLSLVACAVEEVPGAIGKARQDDPCKEEGKYACDNSGDVDRELVCTDSRFEVSQECPGGCKLEEVEDKTFLSCYDEAGVPK